MCHSKDCDSELGFVSDNEFANNDSDLPLELQNSIGIWSTIIYNALNHKSILPDTIKIIAACGGCGYTFCCCCVLFHPNLRTNLISLLPKHPEQGMMSYNEYVQATEFHCNIQGLISNYCFKYDNNNIQDTFISYLNYSVKIQKVVNHDRSSPLKSVKLSYLAIFFFTLLVGLPSM